MKKGPPLPSDSPPPPPPPLPPPPPPPEEEAPLPPPSTVASSSKAPGPTAFKFKTTAAKSKGVAFKMGMAKPKSSPLGVFSSVDDPEPETEPPPPSRPAVARSGLPPPSMEMSTGMMGLTSSLAAAQAAAARFTEQLEASGVSVASGAAAGARAASDPMEEEEATNSTGATEMTRGGYTFCKKYARSRSVPVLASQVRSINCYEHVGKVGSGAFNTIYKAMNRETGEIVALKAMQLSTLERAGQVEGGEGIPLEMMREMSILMSMRHPNIVAVREVVCDERQMYMVMELIDFDLGLLIEHMQQPFSESQVKCLAMQLLSALAAVHECFVLHRDLKQTNILLDKNGILKLCDFGLARRCSNFGKEYTPDVTSLWYRAPEILLGEKRYGTAVDMWSFGCIFAEWLQRGEPLLQGTSEPDQVNTIFKLLGTPSEHSWPNFSKLKAVENGLLQFVECHLIKLGPDGELIKLPKSQLRQKFPAQGYTASAATLGQFRTTALSDVGFELLESLLTCDPERRASARGALESPWFTEEPLPAPLSRSEIRNLRRNRDDAVNSGAHHLAIAQQKAQVASKVAAENAAMIVQTIKEKMGSRWAV